MNKELKLYTRNGLDWSHKFDPIVKALQKLPEKTILDGEAIAVDSKKKMSFSSLQQWLTTGKNATLQFYIFDVLFFSGVDLRPLPLAERQAVLKKYLKTKAPVFLSPQYDAAKLENLMKKVDKEGLEGIIAKDNTASYIGKRSRTWLKYKTNRHEEFVVCGFTPHSKKRGSIGALLLGLMTGKKEIIYCGKVGTGFSEAERRELFRSLSSIAVHKTKIINGKLLPGRPQFCKPEIVCEVGFTEWTSDGMLRHPRYLGTRKDKKAAQVVLASSSHPYTKAAGHAKKK